MNETPQANRIHIAFFGLRNAGKSTLVNAFTGQRLAIVSDTPGTTTDPVSKAMEILPLGPCLVTDTAGLDDTGELGAQRVAKSLAVLATTDVAVWVWGGEEKADGESRWTEKGSGSEKADGEIRWTEKGSGSEKAGGGSRWTADGNSNTDQDLFYSTFQRECRARHVTVLEYHRGDSVVALKEKIAALKLVDDTPGLLDGLVGAGDRVICVCPIDEAAPKGRLILPQVQVIRDCLDRHATCEVCQPEELASVLQSLDSRLQIADCKDSRTLVVTDSQAFGEVRKILSSHASCPPLASHVSCPPFASHALCLPLASHVSCPSLASHAACPSLASRGSRLPTSVSLTSFSILFARQKGDLDEYVKGLAALKRLNDGDTVLVAEGCTHHRQCNDIGTVKIPKALAKLSGRKLNCFFASGGDFPVDAASSPRPSLIVQCGGCMLTRREVLRRIGLARAAGIPIVNYGMMLAAANGLDLQREKRSLR